jgi:hypothetical protein
MALSRSRACGAIALIAALGVGTTASLSAKTETLVSITTVTLVDGPVLIRHGAGEFAPAGVGDVLAAGDTIRTASGASAEITYFEGSSVRLEPQSEIIIASLRPENDISVGRMLTRSWRVVTQLMVGNTRYEVRGPGSTASVRG